MFTIIIVLAGLVQGLVALFVLQKNHKSLTNGLFFILSALMVLWADINFFITYNPFSNEQLFLYRIQMGSVVALNTFFFLFAHTYPGSKVDVKPSYIRLFAFLSLSTFIATLSPLVFTGVSYGATGATPIPGPGMILFAIHAGISVISGLHAMYYRYKNSSGKQKRQLQVIFIDSAIFWGAVPITNFIIPLATKTLFFAKISPIYTLIFSSIIAYAIVAQKLFDIRAAVARSVAYVLLVTTLAGIYIGVVFGISGLFFHAGGINIGQELLSTGLALVLAFTFQPMREFFAKVTDKIFYRDRYDSQYVLNNFSKILVTELDLNRILKRVITELCSELHIQFGQLVIYNNDRVYRVEHYGVLPKRLMIAPELEKLNKSMLIADELEHGERKQIMENHGIRVSMTLRTRDEFIGYLLLGDKLSGDIYSTQDINLFEIIASELAVGISNAKAYAQIQEFNLTLQARVDHATNRLRVANRHLKELDKAKDEFISMASHQLRTPLTTIKGYLSMLLEGDAGKMSKSQAEFVNYAFGSSERMVNLISDLLNVSRLSAGRFLIQTKPTDMVTLIADEVRQLQTHANAKKIKLIFDPPKEILPPAEIDDNKTRQVVMNFIDNAIYYTQKGEVRVVLEQSGDCVRLEVRDSGIGVPDKAKRKLFSKFFRAENAQTIRPDGTGLGLYLAKRVVEDQGGTIIFSSVEGRGSTFGFELPFKPVLPIREVPNARPNSDKD